MIKMKNKYALLFSAVALILSCSHSIQKSETSSPSLQRIAFGSCASQEKDQPIWRNVINKSPELFIFTGDNIYADTEDTIVMKNKYAKLAAKPGYQKLLGTCKVLSVWDDHDYGVNDGGTSYPKKKESQLVFLDFFNVDKNSPRRKRPGIYDAEIFGTAGKKVQVILLDTRYFKDTQIANKESDAIKKQKNLVGWYLPHDDATTTILGNEQWIWLKNQLKEKADVRIIVSSIQAVPYEKGMESWGNFPHERKRLFNLIDETNARGVIFISGDVHFSEISKTNEGPYTLYDFTSSGLTHSHKGWSQAVNNFRIGNAYAEPNFGLINIDWQQKDPLITLQTVGLDDNVKLEHTIKLSELRKR